MSYIPNCREKMLKDAGPFPHVRQESIPEKAINPYWYGLLQGMDAEFIKGFDLNTEIAINNLFDNLEIYAAELEEEGIDVDDIDINIVNGATDDEEDNRECKWYFEYSEEELDKMSKATRIMLLMKYIFNHYIEIQRDELVTSLIENMDEKLHKKAMDEEIKKDN